MSMNLSGDAGARPVIQSYPHSLLSVTPQPTPFFTLPARTAFPDVHTQYYATEYERSLFMGTAPVSRVESEDRLRKYEIESSQRSEDVRKLRLEKEAEAKKYREEETKRRAEVDTKRKALHVNRDRLDQELRQKMQTGVHQGEIDKLKSDLAKRDALLRLKDEEEAIRREEEDLRIEELVSIAEAFKLQEDEEKKQQERFLLIEQERMRRQAGIDRLRQDSEAATLKVEEERKLRDLAVKEAELKRREEEQRTKSQQEREALQAQLQLERQKLERERERIKEQDKKAYEAELRKMEEEFKKKAAVVDVEINPDDIEFGPLVGKGGFGEVFRAKLHGKEVAVKKLFLNVSDDILVEFRSEVAVMSRLRHPNIILFMGACTRPGKLMIVTDLAVASVDKLLSKGTLTLKQRMQFGRDASLGMNWLHRSNPQILHLDLKSGNLLVDQYGTVKVCDFGLSQIRTSQGGGNGAVGTPLWMAPEILLDKPYDEKADIYSFGITLWELYCQKEPYENYFTAFEELVEQVALEGYRPQIPSSCPQRLSSLMKRCWDGDPNKRPSFNDMIKDNAFSRLIVEAVIADQSAADFWHSNWDEKLEVSWSDFGTALLKSAGLTKDKADKQLLALATALGVDSKNTNVTLESVDNMLSWFGPWAPLPALLERVTSVVSNPWFFGNLTKAQANTLLLPQNKGRWIMFFGVKPGIFCLSHKTATEVSHEEIQVSNGSFFVRNEKFSTIAQCLQACTKAFSLGDPCTKS